MFMGVTEGTLPGDGRHSPGESGSSPTVPFTIKQPLLSVRVSGWAGALVFMGVGRGGLCREAALSGGVWLLSDDFLRNKTAPA